MKKIHLALVGGAIIIGIISILAFTNHNKSVIIDGSVQTPETVKKDTSQTLYYGLKAEEIINLPNEKIKSFCESHKITYGQYFVAKTIAETEILKKQNTSDSLELMEMYKELEESLGIK